jgi:hypothetical protein
MAGLPVKADWRTARQVPALIRFPDEGDAVTRR